MKLTTLTLPLISRVKINKKKIIIGGLVLVFALILVAGYFTGRQMDNFPEINLAGLLTALPSSQEKEDAAEEPRILEGKDEGSKVYKETAQAGEGITHLARKALKSYFEAKGDDFNLTPEHKVYAEDYIKRMTGDRWLILGEEVVFSEDLISEAINKALELDQNQLENLKQYSALISSF